MSLPILTEAEVQEDAWKRAWQNRGLCYRLLPRYHGRGIDDEDLVQEGLIGLKRAAELFDPSRGTKFSTYAVYWVRQAMGEAIDNKASAVYVPRWARALARKVAKGQADVGRLKPKHRATALAANVIRKYFPEDLDAFEVPARPDRIDPDEQAAVTAALDCLTPRERMVIEERFAGDQILSAIGDRIGLSRERVRQIEKEALAKLREKLSA